jgi:hypothetical protein
VSSDRNTEPVPELEFGGTVLVPLSCAYSRHDAGSGVGVVADIGVLVRVCVGVAVGVDVGVLVRVAVGVGVGVDVLVAVGVGVGPVDCATTVGGGSNWMSKPSTTTARITCVGAFDNFTA